MVKTFLQIHLSAIQLFLMVGLTWSGTQFYNLGFVEEQQSPCKEEGSIAHGHNYKQERPYFNEGNKWDRRSVCVVIKLDHPYYRTNKRSNFKERDSLRRDLYVKIDSLSKLIEQKYRFKRRKPYQYDYNNPQDFNASMDMKVVRATFPHEVLLFRKQGWRKFGFENEEWVIQLRKEPWVYKVLAPRYLNSNQELTGPHLDNGLDIYMNRSTDQKRINQIFKECGIDSFIKLQPIGNLIGYYHEGKADQLIPDPSVVDQLISYEEVVDVQYSQQDYNCMTCE